MDRKHPMRWKRTAKALLHRLRIDVRPWPIRGTLDGDLAVALRARRISTLVDVGANSGQFGQLARRVGYCGKIISFEPTPSILAELRASARAAPPWEVVDLAVSDVDGEAELHVYENSQLNSLLHATSAGQSWGIRDSSAISVKTRRLDSIADERRLDPTRCFVKIDVQGHDLAVVKGAQNFLSTAAGIQLEIPTVGLYEGSSSFGVTIQAVFDLGFELVGIYAIHRDKAEGLVPIEFDGLFVRPSEDREPR